jgi:protoporphyrinogen oxidase
MAKIVIIGAGLTGLSAAYHLEQSGYTDFKIFEKESTPGGLCRSIYQDGFTFDYTGHLLHISDPYFESIINKCIGKQNLNTVVRRSFIYSHDTYTNYPFQTNLFGLPQKVITECITEFIKRPKQQKSDTFYSWAIKNFGHGLAKHFFVPYQTKIFDYDIRKVTASWTGRFVPKTSLEQMIAGAVSNQAQNLGYNANFFYPKQGGINDWVQKFANQLTTKIKTNYCVESVDFKNKLVLFTNGDFEKYDHLITTMPLKTLLKISTESSNQNLKAAQTKLVCNSVVNFNLGIKRPDVSDKHWIYFPETKYPFYRLGFYHNFSKSVAPPNCSSVYGEFAYVNKTKNQINEKLTTSLAMTKQLLNIPNSDIATQKIVNIPHAYVIYNFWREKNLPKLHKALNNLNIYSCGRYGEWKYSSMQEAVLDGRKVVENILKQSGFIKIHKKTCNNKKRLTPLLQKY